MSTDLQKDKVPGASQSGGGPAPPALQVAAEADSPAIGDWLRFQTEGTVEVLAGKVEVGQGIRTSLAQAVAEELRLPLEYVRTLLGDTALTPYDMGTVGSRSTPVTADRLRKVAASARELFIDRAARGWKLDRAELVAEGGSVSHPPSGRSVPYFELIDPGEKGRLSARWDEDAPVTPPGQWSVAGKSARRPDGRRFVTGSHRYTSDLTRPGMLHGAVLRPPGPGATLVSLDTSAAEELHGVAVVRDGDFVGVVAPTRHAARKALSLIDASWSMPESEEREEQLHVSGSNVFDYLKGHPSAPGGYHRWDGPGVFQVGSLEEGRAAAARSGPGHGTGHTLEARYTIPYIAHAPLETRAALAEWSADDAGDGEEAGAAGGIRLTVWTGTQRPFGVRAELATAFGIPEEQVRVIVPDTGSAYGGKHTGEAAIEAARLARGAGRPVKLIWSREEEFTWAYFRPAGLIEVSSAVAADGTITAWEYHNYNSGPSAIRPLYPIPNQLVVFHTTLSPLRQGSYRALAATANHFARESHIDELAHLLGVDPLEFRLRNLPDASPEQERLRAVLVAATERFGWASREARRRPGYGYGLACGTEKGSYVATCAEVEVERGTGRLGVVRVVEAFECGAIVNPQGLANQVEGAVVQALGGALFERVEFGGGNVESNRFSRYRVPRFGDVPQIEVVLVDRKDL
ncbi:MAG TPA: molybdopterin cofactor-binding domain-containing protein, partial [Chloroflexia bacterium]|nr:molybdopterin cofactor-binding domain-containing protein [Chloroflexia bacterium]